MKFGLTQEQYNLVHDVAVLPFKNLNGKVWCFGSRARGDHRPFSDLDLLVELIADDSALVSRIRESLEESNFPFKVDIVLSSKLASSYLENVEKEKVPF